MCKGKFKFVACKIKFFTPLFNMRGQHKDNVCCALSHDPINWKTNVFTFYAFWLNFCI